ncbi:unnamed protein product [Dovyalis caffra]|uniref:Pentatricopeptide repeat-containing protein n=1 Tax=Dovyalis caffra TaxID=77055 RepID=A0AAV1QS63_9ROSI|nr:unnamed protein product [Dovyalis caffra]
MGTRHTSVDQEALQHVIAYGKDEGALENVLLGERKRNKQGKLASAMISTPGYGNTVYAFSAIISAYGRSGYCNEAIKVFDSMKDYGLKPNLVSYNAVIDAYEKGGVEFKLVVEIFYESLEMECDRIELRLIPLFVVCSRGGLLAASQCLSLAIPEFLCGNSCPSLLLIPFGIMFYGLQLLKLFG